jgi:hypothetical protein
LAGEQTKTRRCREIRREGAITMGYVVAGLPARRFEDAVIALVEEMIVRLLAKGIRIQRV